LIEVESPPISRASHFEGGPTGYHRLSAIYDAAAAKYAEWKNVLPFRFHNKAFSTWFICSEERKEIAAWSAATQCRGGASPCPVGAGIFMVPGMMRPLQLAARGNRRLEITRAGTQAIPIAIPNFVGRGSPAGWRGRGSAFTPGHHQQSRRRGLFRADHQARLNRKKSSNIDRRAAIQNWETINAKALAPAA